MTLKISEDPEIMKYNYDYTALNSMCIYFCSKLPKNSTSTRHIGIVTDINYNINSKEWEVTVYTTKQVINAARNRKLNFKRAKSGFLYFYINTNIIFNMDFVGLKMEYIKYITKEKGDNVNG